MDWIQRTPVWTQETTWIQFDLVVGGGGEESSDQDRPVGGPARHISYSPARRITRSRERE